MVDIPTQASNQTNLVWHVAGMQRLEVWNAIIAECPSVRLINCAGAAGAGGVLV